MRAEPRDPTLRPWEPVNPEGEEPVPKAKLWLESKSRMRRESHVRFREGAGVQLPRATRLEIEVSLGACTEKSVTFAFRVRRAPEGEPVATGEITCVAIDHGWHSIPLPREWRERLVGSASPPPNRP